jgi:hypothetical protein
MNLEVEKGEKEFEKIQNGYYDLLKNCTILAGTIFASSIALATGNKVNCFFIVGELFLLLSTLVGVFYLWKVLRGRETMYFIMNSTRLKWNLTADKGMSEFLREEIQSNIKDFERLADKRSIFDQVFKVIKIDWIPTIFFVFLSTGLIFIWMSLIVK